MKKKKTLITIAFLCVLGAVFLSRSYSEARTREEQKALTAIARQFGSAEEWHSARFAIYCKVFQSGRTVSEIESDLNKIGDWRVYSDETRRQYKLDGISAGNEFFDILAVLDGFQNVREINVIEKIGDSDRQTIVCTDRDYFYKSELNQKLVR